MRKRCLAGLLMTVLVVQLMTAAMVAKAAEVTSVDAPEHFGVYPYLVDSFIYTISAPDDMRSLIEAESMTRYVKVQFDYKMDEGDWHYTPDWDNAGVTLKNTLSFTFMTGEAYIAHTREKLSNLFPDDKTILEPVMNRTNNWDFFKDHRFYFRVRFVVSVDNGQSYIYSDWTEPYELSDEMVVNPDTYMNHAPSLTTAVVEKNSGGSPYLYIQTGRLPGQVQDLNAMTGEGVWTEVWMRQEGDTDFIQIHDSFFANEYIIVDVDDYFSKSQASYEEEAYEIKIRYSLDLRKYPQANRSDKIYSPFSNVLAQNMPAWSNAHPWAEGELLLADEANLIPEVLRGQDLTRPITREEFAELAVLLYETTTGKSAIAASPNPFTDTTNPQVLKAYQLGITTGTSATTFAPDVLINREQCATMLFRDIQAIVPEGDFSVIGVADFADQKFISAYAVAATKFMSQLGIIKGDSAGNFMPRATTAAQTAANYGMATREQAIMMSYRIFSEYK